jgi:hypothetical protein
MSVSLGRLLSGMAKTGQRAARQPRQAKRNGGAMGAAGNKKHARRIVFAPSGGCAASCDGEKIRTDWQNPCTNRSAACQ